MAGERKNIAAKYYWMLVYFLLGSGIPLLFLFIEYYQSTPLHGHNFVPYVLTTYSPLFIYACIAGFLLPLYIVPAYSFFKASIDDPQTRRIQQRFLIAAILVATLVTIADFFGGDPAIWEVKPPYHKAFIDHFINADESTTTDAKLAYKTGIENILNEGISNWSMTRFTYIFSVFIEAFFLNAFFYLSFLFYAFRRALKYKDEAKFYKLANGLVISSLLIFVWLVLRTMNGMEKLRLYPGATLQVADIGVGLLNILCLFAIILARLNNRKIRKLAEETLSIAAATGITLSSILAYLNKDMLVLYFGKKAGIVNYLVFPVVFLLLYAAYFIVNMGSEFNKRHSIPAGEEDN